MGVEPTARRNPLKIRIAASIALAAGLAFGATGCSLIAPVATVDPYAPSDGITVSTDGVDVRNMMLVADETGENQNVVFGSVNNSGAPATLSVKFVVDGSAAATAEFKLDEGAQLFGNPEDEASIQLVSVDAIAGSTVKAYFSVNGGAEVEHNVPILDGTLKEYQAYVLSAPVEEAADDAVATDKAATDKADTKAEAPAAQ